MSAMTPVLFVSPAAMVEHGAALRAGWKALRRLAVAATAPVRAAAARRSGPLDHAERSRRRRVAAVIEQMRRGAYAEAVLGGPWPR